MIQLYLANASQVLLRSSFGWIDPPPMHRKLRKTTRKYRCLRRLHSLLRSCRCRELLGCSDHRQVLLRVSLRDTNGGRLWIDRRPVGCQTANLGDRYLDQRFDSRDCSGSHGRCLHQHLLITLVRFRMDSLGMCMLTIVGLGSFISDQSSSPSFVYASVSREKAARA